MRKIKIANVQKRDAEIVFGGLFRKPIIQYTLQDGTKTRNIKVLKSDLKGNMMPFLMSMGVMKVYQKEFLKRIQRLISIT
ncbi:MAG: hypothetical protein IPL23_11660 [Saprospiraceae bacterium]|nr:hypothetical protein [Saprospiraceae bacterium]